MRLNLHFPDGPVEIEIGPGEAGLPLSSVLRHAGKPLNTRCGERGLCKGCEVELGGQIVRACTLLAGDASGAVIPPRSVLAYQPQVVSRYKTEVSVADEPLLGPGSLGVAIDIGTTTVVVQGIRHAEAKPTGEAAAFNAQMRMGDDVLTRINLCMTDPGAVKEMQRLIVEETLAPLIREALGETQPEGYAIAANATMLHLLTGTDPSSIGVAPFLATFLEHKVLRAGDLGLEPADAPVHLLPSASAYLGADVVAGLFATGMLYEPGPALLVDVGTNGEVLLARDGELWGCATAAGPAFEGSGLSFGVRAGDGAISHIEFVDGVPIVEVIGEVSGRRATGLCGTAYVDFLASARRAGILSETGRFVGPVGEHEGIAAVAVARGQGARDVMVTQHDVASLMQSKAAIAAGILTLLARAGLVPSDVKRLYLAGGFGLHLRLQNAIDCGLLPGFTPEQIDLVGNTSLGGAMLALRDAEVLEELKRAAEGIQVVELNLDPDFEDRFIDQLALP